MSQLIEIIRNSLLSITHPRFYDTERGFQGELLAEIRKRIPELHGLDVIIEQEHQKRLAEHGLTIRPDMIIHVPFQAGRHQSRTEENYAVFELKKKSTKVAALKDFKNLAQMCALLNYALAIFINIGSEETFIEYYNGPHKEKIYACSVWLSKDGQVNINESYTSTSESEGD